MKCGKCDREMVVLTAETSGVPDNWAAAMAAAEAAKGLPLIRCWVCESCDRVTTEEVITSST